MISNQAYVDYEDEDTYPLFGDESSIYYEAKSQNRFYLKLERRRSQALFGDFDTSFFDTKLSAYL